MKLFDITFKAELSGSFTVDAENEEEAKILAIQIIQDITIEDSEEVDIICSGEIEEIKEK